MKKTSSNSNQTDNNIYINPSSVTILDKKVKEKIELKIM